MADDSDHVFEALANRDRRRMLDLVQQSPGMTIAAVGTHFEMSSVGVLKHIRILERSGLLHSEKQGRVRKLYFNAVPIQRIYDRWTDQYSQFWAARMMDMAARLETRAKGVSHA
ncbi:MAG TPA: helix-turn-helix domain-containing protein [Phycisphaerales bacterium]|nr:helix-turn-helix domain-containing protein [Phycisphaerales bacterium]